MKRALVEPASCVPKFILSSSWLSTNTVFPGFSPLHLDVVTWLFPTNRMEQKWCISVLSQGPLPLSLCQLDTKNTSSWRKQSPMWEETRFLRHRGMACQQERLYGLLSKQKYTSIVFDLPQLTQELNGGRPCRPR